MLLQSLTESCQYAPVIDALSGTTYQCKKKEVVLNTEFRTYLDEEIRAKRSERIV